MSLLKGASRVAGAAGAAGVLLMAMANPAAAVDYKSEEGADYAIVFSNRRDVGACDMEQDGNGVYGQFRWLVGTTVHQHTVSDGNGAAGGCGNWRASRDIVSFRVCEDDWGTDTCDTWTPTR